MKRAICHITTVHGPFDGRIFQKQCRSLARMGFEVYEVAPHPRDEVADGVQVLGIRRRENRLSRMTLGPWEAFRRAIRTGARICHFHDPELIPMGVLLSLLGRRVIYDAHEPVRAQIRNKLWIRPAFLRPLCGFLVGVLERVGALFFSRVVGAIDETAQRFGRKGVAIRNLPVLQLARDAEPSRHPKDQPVVIYCGGITRDRGIGQLIQAFSHLRGQAELWLVGRWESVDFRRKCEALPGFNSVRYLGAVHPDEVFSHIKQAEIGACTLLPRPNYLLSLPTKVYEYLACGVPALISDFPHWRRHFAESVVFVDPEDSKEIAVAIRSLLADSEHRSTYGQRGQEFLAQGLSWELEEQKLAALYAGLL